MADAAKPKKRGIPQPTDEQLRKFYRLSMKVDKPVDYHFFEESYRGNIMFKDVDGCKIMVNKNYEDEDYSSEIKESFTCGLYIVIITARSIYIIFNPATLNSS